MKRAQPWRVALTAILITAQLTIGSVAVAAEGDFIVDGGGWGHGVGMSQYGSYGMALEGSDVDGIISHYYSGAVLKDATSLGTLPGWLFEEQALAVNVASGRTQLDFLANGGILDVCQRGDGTNDCAAIDVSIAPGQRLRVTVSSEDGSRCERRVLDADANVIGEVEEGDCSFDLTWDDEFTTQPLTFVHVEELRYARGPMEIRPNDTGPTFDTVVMLELEEYLYGIAESFLSWPDAALQAQAVASRSYALSVIAARGGADGSGRLPECGCHIRRTPADQNYDAYLGSTPNVVRWKAAVDQTRHQVVTHSQVGGGNEVVTTYYSSSTGGMTENVEDVFEGPPQPHLKSVDDHWAVGSAVNNPFASWSKTVPKESAAAALGWDEVRFMRLVAGPPGSRVQFDGFSNGEPRTATLSGWEVRQLVDLRSPYISKITKEGPPPPPFTDIDTSIHYEAIGFIWRAGITKGCNPPDNTLYCPGESVTRQQMASFLVRALGLPTATADNFVDDDGSVHEANINALAEAGITKGCNPPANDRFCPDQAVTRGQMAAFLVRAFGYTDPGPGNLFVDDDSSIFQNDIDRLATAGVTRGCNPPANDRFCPGEAVTRAQMASFLTRAVQGG